MASFLRMDRLKRLLLSSSSTTSVLFTILHCGGSTDGPKRWPRTT